MYRATIGNRRYAFADLKTLMAKASPLRSGDQLAGVAAESGEERVAAQFALADLPLATFLDWLLSDEAPPPVTATLAPGITPEMAAAVSKVSRLQDLMLMAAKCSVVTRFRNTVGLPGRLSVRLQPNHPTDDTRGIAA